MSNSGADRLYELLPALYRARDLARGQPLRALLGVMGEEYDRLQASIRKLEASWFIETCNPEVIPFIADLVGVRREDVARVPPRMRRAFVGNAIRLRRRKGIAAALERAIGDATGWTAHAVEMFEHLGLTQNVEHPGAGRGRLFDASRAVDVVPEPGLDLGACTAAVDAPSAAAGFDAAGRAGPRTLDVFVSRLQSYPVEWSEPFRVREGCFTFHPLGLDTPLHTQPASDDDPLRPHGLTDLAAPIPPEAFAADLVAYAEHRAEDERRDPARANLEGRHPSSWLGPGRSIDVQVPVDSIDPATVVARDLAHWERPEPGRVAIDVRLGRLSFPPGKEPAALRVSWSFGRVEDIGAGPYPRDPDPTPGSAEWRADVSKTEPVAASGARSFRSLRDAIRAWDEAVVARAPGAPRLEGLIRVLDSSTYAGELLVRLAAHGLRIEAEDGEVPTIASPIDVHGEKGASLVVAGLQIGVAHAGPAPALPPPALVCSGHLALTLVSCTVHGAIAERNPHERLAGLVGQALARERTRIVELLASDRLSLALVRCLVGPVRMAGPSGLVQVAGSIVDGRGGPAIAGLGADTGPAVALSRSTVIGDVSAEVVLEANECLFTGAVRARRVQASVLRFSALPYASRELPRHRSVLFGAPPDAPEEGAAAGEPRFTSIDPGHPAYGRLTDETPVEILAGAEDGGELGAFHDAGERPRREALRAVLDDFVPYHLSADVFFLD